MSARQRAGFTLPELIVVIGIIVILIALLLPAIQRARGQAWQVRCQANMHDIARQLVVYANNWRGWLYPPDGTADKPQDQRWPAIVLKPPVWNARLVNCPADNSPALEHSYVLNYHVYLHKVRHHTHQSRIHSSEVIVMGEKQTRAGDYYMTTGEFTAVVEQRRHGRFAGSNYLFLDLHVGAMPPSNRVRFGADPWDLPDSR